MLKADQNSAVVAIHRTFIVLFIDKRFFIWYNQFKAFIGGNPPMAIRESINKADYDYPYIGIGTRFDNNPLHFHAELELLYVLSGEINAALESDKFKLKEGDICVILPGRIHTLLQTGQIKLFVLKLLPAEPLYGLLLSEYVFSQGDAHYPFFKNEIERVMREDEQKAIGYKLAIKNACDALTLHILRSAAPNADARELANKQAFGLDLFEKANAYIAKNYKGDISLDLVCAEFGYSRAYFSRLFKAVCGINFFDYLSIYRLKKSTELLADKDITIEGVALASGFHCLRSYNRAFLKFFGQSPGSYRRSYFCAK